MKSQAMKPQGQKVMKLILRSQSHMKIEINDFGLKLIISMNNRQHVGHLFHFSKQLIKFLHC